jgi:hypothetical protein
MSAFRDTKFTASTYRCSGCGYASLAKNHVLNHVRAKCPSASVTTESQLVSHFDEHDDARFRATLYQCSKCFYTTDDKQKSERHVRTKKCFGADVLCSKRILNFESVAKVHVVHGDEHNETNNIETNNGVNYGTQNNIHLHFYPMGTSEESIAMLKALSAGIEPMTEMTKTLTNCSTSDLPTVLSTIMRTVDPGLDNKYILNNDVVSRADESVKMPKVRHSKKEIFRLMNVLFEFMKTPGRMKEWYEYAECEAGYGEDDVVEVRSKLLERFYKDESLDAIRTELVDSSVLSELGNIVVDAVKNYRMLPDSIEYTLMKKFVEDSDDFNKIVDDDSRDVRESAKKYLASLPIERKRKGRPKKEEAEEEKDRAAEAFIKRQRSLSTSTDVLDAMFVADKKISV